MQSFKRIKGSSSVPLNSVKDIDHETAEFYHQFRKGLSEMEHYELEKFALKERVPEPTQDIWETWLKSPNVVKNAYNFIHRTPRDLFEFQREVRVVELVDKRIAQLKCIQECGLDFTRSWTMKLDDVPAIGMESFSVRVRSDKTDKPQELRHLCSAFEKWGLNLKVSQKRKRHGDILDYDYTLVFDYDNSVVSRIIAKQEIFPD